MPEALDMNTIAALLAADKARPASTGRKKKDPTEPREYATWWKLPQSAGSCSNEVCADPREGGGHGGTAMVTTINDKEVCRYCFLEGYARVGT